MRLGVSLKCAAAYKHFASAGEGLYSLFGLLETQIALGKTVDALDYARVLQESTNELGTRTEPRTLVLLEETRMIAQFRDAKTAGVEISATYDNLRRAFKAVGSAVSIYSQLEKRNLLRDDFEIEAHHLHSFMLQNVQVPATRHAAFPPVSTSPRA